MSNDPVTPPYVSPPHDRRAALFGGGGLGVILQTAVDRWELEAAALFLVAGAIAYYGYRQSRRSS